MSIGSVTAAANSAILTSERTQAALVSSASRLASGKQIQTAADNPSGLAIYETLTAQAAGLEQATNNVGNAQNAAGVAEGALSQVSAVVSQLNTLSIAASNDFLSPVQRQALQAQANQDAAQINTISQNTNFNGQPLLQNNGQPLNVQATAAEGGTVGVAFGTTNARTLGVSNLDFGTTAAAETAIGTSQTAIDTVATTVPKRGADGRARHPSPERPDGWAQPDQFGLEHRRSELRPSIDEQQPAPGPPGDRYDRLAERQQPIRVSQRTHQRGNRASLGRGSPFLPRQLT